MLARCRQERLCQRGDPPLQGALGRGDQVIPLIIAGEPSDPEQKCFPPALRGLKAAGKLDPSQEKLLAAVEAMVAAPDAR